jgi:hypothetical protein
MFDIISLGLNWLELESGITFVCAATFMSMWWLTCMSHTVYAGVIRGSERDTFDWAAVRNLVCSDEIQCKVF